MTIFRRRKEVITQKILQSITFADTEQIEIDEIKLNAGELIIMKEFLNNRGYFE